VPAAGAGLSISEKTLNLARRNFALTAESYRLGKADILSYLDARNNLLRARLNYRWAKYQLILKALDLYITAGKIEEFVKELKR